MVVAAVCPHPPLLVPELAAGAAPELDDLRGACAAALDTLRAARPDVVVAVGAGATTRWPDPAATGSFAPYGLPIEVRLPGDPAAAANGRLPLSLTVGAWLLAQSDASAPETHALEVAGDAPVAECLTLGARCADRAERTALLVLGDGTARRGDRAPGYRDPRAEPFDAAVARALRTADPAALAALDPALAADLMAAGRAPWQVLAGAARAPYTGRLLYARAPYGVTYFVATWEAT
jgi:hypothetical protein